MNVSVNGMCVRGGDDIVAAELESKMRSLFLGGGKLPGFFLRRGVDIAHPYFGMERSVSTKSCGLQFSKASFFIQDG